MNMREETLSIKEVDFKIEEARLHISLKIKNDSERTIHSYGSIRYLDYDSNTGTLKISLSDKHMAADNVLKKHLKTPGFVPLEPKQVTTINVNVPLSISQLTGKLKADKTPEVKVIDLSQVKKVEFEVDYSETPFYYNPEEPDMLMQLTKWGKSRIKGEAKVQIKRPTNEKQSQNHDIK